MNKGKPEMEAERALCLLNAMIDHMINEEGGHAHRVIPVLLELGFTADELVNQFHFSQREVAAANAGE